MAHALADLHGRPGWRSRRLPRPESEGDQRSVYTLKLLQLALDEAHADYFFVNKQDTKLAQAINTGLERALANGQFDRLFYAFNGAQIRQARLAQRTVIELHNPQLPEGTPLGRKALWFDPLGPVPIAPTSTPESTP